MEVYRGIAADTSAPREVRAKALLRLARCQEELGQHARQVYEQIVRDFADQPAAAQARSRLLALSPREPLNLPKTMSVRKIEATELMEFGPTDTDGQRAVYKSKNGDVLTAFSNTTPHAFVQKHLSRVAPEKALA